MFAAAAAAASGQGNRVPSFFGQLPGNKRPSGLESPPASLENRSTPGSLDLSRTKGGLEDDNDFEDMDSNDMPPTMVPRMEPKIKLGAPPEVSEPVGDLDEDIDRRDTKRGFSDDAEDLSMDPAKRVKRDTSEDEDDKPPKSEEEGSTKGGSEDCERLLSEGSNDLAKDKEQEQDERPDSQKSLSVKPEFREESA